MDWIKKLDRKLDGTALAKARDAAVRGVKKFALNESELEIATEEATNGEPWGPHGTAMAGEGKEWRGTREGEREERREEEAMARRAVFDCMPLVQPLLPLVFSFTLLSRSPFLSLSLSRGSLSHHHPQTSPGPRSTPRGTDR